MRRSSTLYSQPDGCGNHAPDRSQGFRRARGYGELIFTVRVSNLHLQFSYEILSQRDFIEKRKYLANGTGQKELSEKEFLQFRIELPPLPEQTAIAKILSTADREIELLQKDLAEEKQKKKALMQLLLTGIVRV